VLACEVVGEVHLDFNDRVGTEVSLGFVMAGLMVMDTVRSAIDVQPHMPTRLLVSVMRIEYGAAVWALFAVNLSASGHARSG